MRDVHEIGSELRRALEARGCALSAAEARNLSATLIDLIASGLLVAKTSSEADTPETAPAYNMGQSLYIEGGDRE